MQENQADIDDLGLNFPPEIVGEEEETDDQESIESSFKSALGAKLKSEFSEAERRRALVEQDWLQALRQYKGQYEDSVQIQEGKSRAFIRLTRSKVKAVDARMTDMLFPTEDCAWSLNPTPVPELSPQVLAQLQQKAAIELQQEAMKAQQTGQAVGETGEDEKDPEEELEEKVSEYAEKACQKMSKKIEDVLKEGNWAAVARDCLHSGHLYGTGILKGPMLETRIKISMQQNPETGEVVPVDVPKQSYFFTVVPVWNIYPDPFAIHIKDCDYIFERHVMTRRELLALADVEGFDGEAIKAYLRNMPSGDLAGLKFHEQSLRSIDKRQSTLGTPTDRYEVLERWGVLKGSDLRAMGLDVNEEDDIECQAWLLGEQIIRVLINPFAGKARPYKFYYFERNDTSIWGVGVPELMRHPQHLYNGAVRMMIDNAAITSGPMVEIDTQIIESRGIDARNIQPWTTFIRKPSATGQDRPGIRTHEFNSRMPELMNMAQMFQELCDESSGIPRFSYGDQTGAAGAAKTMGGLSMLMGQANIQLKEMVRNWDDGITSPFITELYHLLAEHEPDKEIVGDFEVIARGSSSLVARELRNQALMQFAAMTNNPVDSQFTKRVELLRAIAQSMDLTPDTILYSEEEQGQIAQLQGQLQQMQQAVQPVQELAMKISKLSGGMPPEAVLEHLANMVDSGINPLSAGIGEENAQQAR